MGQRAALWMNVIEVANLGAPACPHIVVTTDWLAITHQSKVHCRANQFSVETQIHPTHWEQGALWYR